ncbi:sodium/hydrogen exchanger 10-like [Coccinella septempunctata]|uniref:sodium/hydrogen exchanger 10-like n=1 Tax=Coccinella septempunctata TaxID=41139 RepID=UPI001D072A89|nr:sodium/hydrogen exchanger 10-like [Coccinella septempunctata]
MTRSVIMSLKLPIDLNGPLLIYGILVGLCCRLSGFSFLIDIPLLQSFTMYSIAVPIMLYKMCFYSDLQGLQKNIFQTLLISGPGLVGNAILVGTIIRYLLAKDWKLVDCVMFGTACVVIYPKENIMILRQQGTESKHISILLEGETIFGTFMAFGLYHILLTGFVSYLEKVKDIVIVVMRYALGGTIVGYIMGEINCFFFWTMSSNVSNIVLFSTTLPLVTYYICSYIIGISGSIAISICGLMMDSRRSILNKRSTVLWREYWQIISFITESIVSTSVGAIVGYTIVWSSSYTDYVFMVLIYCATYCGRFIIYVILAPLSSRLGYGMNIRCMIVAVWGGTPSLINICIAMLPWQVDGSTEKAIPMVFFYVTGLVIISLILNIFTLSPLLMFLKMDVLSSAREKEVMLSLNHLKGIQMRMMMLMKLENLMSETSWKSVEQLTTLENPFGRDFRDSEEYELEENIGYCSECNQEIYLFPNHQEYTNLKCRISLRLLYTRETLLIDSFSKGLISEKSFKTLNSMIKRAFDNPNNEIEIKDLVKLFKTEKGRRKNRSKCTPISCSILRPRDFPSKKPNAYWRRLCYHEVRRHRFHVFMLAVILTNMTLILVETCINTANFMEAKDVFLAFDIIFVFIYTSELLINIAARSARSFCKDGLKNYFRYFQISIRLFFHLIYRVIFDKTLGKTISDFRSKYNCFDFAILITIWTSAIMDSYSYVDHAFEMILLENRLWFSIFKSLRLLRIIEYCFYSKMVFVKTVECWKHRRLLQAYDIGKDFWIQEKRLEEEILPLFCEDTKMRRDFCARMEMNLSEILHELRKIQHEHPWIAVTAKTKYAAKLSLVSMAETVENLMIAGWIDNTEYATIYSKLSSLMSKCERLKKLKDNDPEKIFSNTSWLRDYSRSNALLKEAKMIAFDSGEILFAEGDLSDGIYVIVSGTCNMFYVPKEEYLTRLDKFGELPVLDHIASRKFEQTIHDKCFLSGMTLGELSFLTGKGYAASIAVDFPMKAYFLSSAVLRKMMEDEEPNDGLECKMWKYVSKNLASSLLMEIFEKSMEPTVLQDNHLFYASSLTLEEPFFVEDSVKHVILIEGIIRDATSGRIYKAPCVIPRSVKEILFPENVVSAKILLTYEREFQE